MLYFVEGVCFFKCVAYARALFSHIYINIYYIYFSPYRRIIAPINNTCRRQRRELETLTSLDILGKMLPGTHTYEKLINELIYTFYNIR